MKKGRLGPSPIFYLDEGDMKTKSNQSAPGTVRVIYNGQVRLSADLIIAKEFRVEVINRRGKKKLMLIPVDLAGVMFPANGHKLAKVYFQNARSRSGRISLPREIRQLGLDPDKLRGKEFSARTHGGTVIINFKESV